MLAGRYHLAWSAPLMGAGYYIPNYFLHLFMIFIPALVLGGTWHRGFILAAFITGPVMTEAVMRNAGLESRSHELPAVWCLFSAGQVGNVATGLNLSYSECLLCMPRNMQCMFAGSGCFAFEAYCVRPTRSLASPVCFTDRLRHPGRIRCEWLCQWQVVPPCRGP
jgi:hypothetical protein